MQISKIIKIFIFQFKMWYGYIFSPNYLKGYRNKNVCKPQHPVPSNINATIIALSRVGVDKNPLTPFTNWKQKTECSKYLNLKTLLYLFQCMKSFLSLRTTVKSSFPGYPYVYIFRFFLYIKRLKLASEVSVPVSNSCGSAVRLAHCDL